MFYQTLPSGSKVIRPEAWIGVANMFTMVLISMFCVFFFGLKCYRLISQEISELAIMSKVAKSFQKQLFYALMVQTMIPLVLIYIPAFGYLLCPMLDLDYDFANDFMMATITLYPAIDPLPSFVIIKNYRNALLECFRCKKKKEPSRAPHPTAYQ